MGQKKYHISKRGLQSIISAVEQKDDQFFWMTSPTFDKQLYISPQFENIWDRKVETLYEHPQSWMENLVNEEENEVYDKLSRRALSLKDEEREGTIIMRISRPNGELEYLRDSSFCLHDDQGHLVAMAGIGQVISYEEWCYELDNQVREVSLSQRYCDRKLLLPTNDYSESYSEVQILHKKFGKKFLVVTRIGEVIFTKREFDCLNYFLVGLTAKQTAKELDISFRTVEIHMENIKNKLRCESKNDIRSMVKYMIR